MDSYKQITQLQTAIKINNYNIKCTKEVINSAMLTDGIYTADAAAS